MCENNPPSAEEIQRMKDEHWEKMKREGSTMSQDEWNVLMNYYDDKANKDETFEEYKKRHGID